MHIRSVGRCFLYNVCVLGILIEIAASLSYVCFMTCVAYYFVHPTFFMVWYSDLWCDLHEVL